MDKDKTIDMENKMIKLILGFFLGFICVSGYAMDKEKEGADNYVLIPMGSAIVEDTTISVGAFWISKYEITNKAYREFLDDLKANGKTKELAICEVQNKNWVSILGKQYEPYAEYYFMHIAYEDYPVLNISYQAAKLYCKWLTEKSKEEGVLYRLPTKNEWVYAAMGGLDHIVYSWGGNYLRDKEGSFVCNFKHVGDEFIHEDESNGMLKVVEIEKLNPSNTITSPVDSYFSNAFGLFNMCGNVAEMIAENGTAVGGSWNSTGYDVRILSMFKYTTPNPLVGFRPIKVKVKP